MQFHPSAKFPKRPKRKPKPPKCKACGRENGPLIEGKCASCTGLGV